MSIIATGINLVGLGGDCAADCGTCGSGYTCPSAWTNTVSYTVQTSGSNLIVNGTSLAVGGTVSFDRYTIPTLSRRDFGYPVGIYRASNSPPAFTPDDSSGTFTISGLTGDMAAWNGNYAKTSAGNYYKTSGSNYRVALASGVWRLAYFGFGAAAVISGNSFTYSGSTYGAPTSGSGVITYSGTPQPGSALPSGVIEWKIEVICTPGTFDLVASTAYLSYPVSTSPLSKTLPWGAISFRDTIKVLSAPSGINNAISTTIQSACVSPPP